MDDGEVQMLPVLPRGYSDESGLLSRFPSAIVGPVFPQEWRDCLTTDTTNSRITRYSLFTI